MKKVIFGLVVFALLLATSCKKNSDSQPHYWSFENINYPEYGALGTGAEMDATSINPISSFSVLFPGGTLPTTNGTYTVINAVNVPIGTGQAGIFLENGPTYQSTGGNGHQSISVTVSGGKVSITGSNIELMNQDSPYDSAVLNFNIVQTQ